LANSQIYLLAVMDPVMVITERRTWQRIETPPRMK
jgi:hypothetical protein